MSETPLRSALYELARIMEILDEDSAAAVEYRVRYLVDLKKRVDDGVSNANDNFFEEAKRLQEALSEAPEAIKDTGLRVVLGMMYARGLAEERAAKEIADLKQQLRDSDSESSAADAVRASVVGWVREAPADRRVTLTRAGTPPEVLWRAFVRTYVSGHGQMESDEWTCVVTAHSLNALARTLCDAASMTRAPLTPVLSLEAERAAIAEWLRGGAVGEAQLLSALWHSFQRGECAFRESEVATADTAIAGER